MTTLTNVKELLSSVTTLPQEQQPQSHPRRVDEPWSASRAEINADEKELMAKYFCQHDFLVDENKSPEAGRETVASIIVNQGTSPNRVVEEALQWIREQDEHESSRKPFFLTWYTPGHLVPTTLKEFRDEHRHLKTATKLFLFPGEVDEETEAVSGPDAERYAEQLQRRFTYAFLSAYSFDVCTGSVYFHSPHELRLQKACATRFASHKFLFLDSSKFKSEGGRGYSIRDLLETADKVTVYTVSSPSSLQDQWIKTNFQNLCEALLEEPQNSAVNGNVKVKTLCLQIVGRNTASTDRVEKSGLLVANRRKRSSR